MPLQRGQRAPSVDSRTRTAASVGTQSQDTFGEGMKSDRTNVTAQLLELEVRRQSSLP